MSELHEAFEGISREQLSVLLYSLYRYADHLKSTVDELQKCTDTFANGDGLAHVLSDRKNELSNVEGLYAKLLKY